ncbi:unnamed protein product [Sphenostylis stenocarpa]|uniref:Uncharacterized protein n=1 Tax=Sphenostylis stenocarpa TaxID=92480 RepID=A0AA86SWD6_9FABA|nr:unnamed protein product [Sphenostylis stenocarpa]
MRFCRESPSQRTRKRSREKGKLKMTNPRRRKSDEGSDPIRSVRCSVMQGELSWVSERESGGSNQVRRGCRRGYVGKRAARVTVFAQPFMTAKLLRGSAVNPKSIFFNYPFAAMAVTHWEATLGSLPRAL